MTGPGQGTLPPQGTQGSAGLGRRAEGLAAAEEQALAAAPRSRPPGPRRWPADERGPSKGRCADTATRRGPSYRDRVREQLSLVLEGALRRGHAPDPLLLSGPLEPEAGATFAIPIAGGAQHLLRRSPPGKNRGGPGTLTAILSTLKDGDVVFIDEIHRPGPA